MKLKNIKSILTNSNILYAISNIVFLGTIFLADVYIARFFPLEKVGAWKQLILLVQFTGALLSFGVIEGFRFNISKESTLINMYLGASVTFFFFVALCIWAVLLFSESRVFIATLLGIDIIAKTGLLIPILYLLLSINTLYQQICLARDKIRIIFFAMISFSICFYIALFTFLSIRTVKFEICIFLSFIIAFLLQSIIYISQTKVIPYFFIKKIRFFLVNNIKFGFPLFVATYIGILTLNIDKVIINKLGGIEAFAVYSIGALEIPIIALITKSITNISYPKIVSLVNNNNLDDAKILWIKDLMRVSYISYPIICLMMVFSKTIIVGIFGINYILAVPVFKSYCLILLWRNAVYGTLLSSQEKTYLITKYSFIALLINIILSFFLFKIFGIIGVIYSTFIAITVLHLLFMRNEKVLYVFFKAMTSIRMLFWIICVFVCYFILSEY